MKMSCVRSIIVCALLLAPAMVQAAGTTPDSEPEAPMVPAPSRPPFAYASPPSSQQEVPDGATWSEEVKTLLDASNFTQAIVVLSEYVDSDVTADPMTDAAKLEVADAYNLMGYSYRSLSPPQLNTALDKYRLALTYNPNHCGVYEYMGEAYLQMTDLPNAQAQLAELNTRCAGSEETGMLVDAIAAYEDQQKVFAEAVTPPTAGAAQHSSVALMTLFGVAALFASTI